MGMRHNRRMEENAEQSDAEWFTSDGEPYTGDVFENDKGKPYGELNVDCPRCGGSGRYRRKFDCLKCSGEGALFEQPRLYSAKEIEARQRKKAKVAKDREDAETARAADRALAYQDFLLRNQPMVERIVASGDKFALDVLTSAEKWGAPTDAQWAAVVEKLDRIDREKALYSASQPVGVVGQRMDLEVTCTGRSSFMAKGFGRNRSREVFVTEMAGPDGNAFVCVSESFSLKPGERASVRGTVKGHDLERRAWPRTELSRVAVLERLPALEENSAPHM